MGSNCCKSEEEEITEHDDYNQNTYNQNSHDDIFKTRLPCWYHHHCPCPCHNQGGSSTLRSSDHRGGSCTFKLKSK